jgi:hypothetical protein
MDQETVDLVLGLAQNGMKGDRRAFQLRLRKIVSRLRKSEPELAGRLVEVLSERMPRLERYTARQFPSLLRARIGCAPRTF